jgi:uncharacterized membrane protein
MTRDRLEAFSDGVFSVAATLLVLDIKLADVQVSSNSQLNARLMESMPNILTFVFTFLVVGVFWVGHLRILSNVKEASHYLIWSNIFYLLTIAIIPFAAALLAKHPFYITSVIFYSIVLFLCGIQHVILLGYLNHHKSLLEKPPAPTAFKKSMLIALTGPVCYVLAAFSCLFYLPVSFLFILAALAFYIFLIPRFLKNNS